MRLRARLLLAAIGVGQALLLAPGQALAQECTHFGDQPARYEAASDRVELVAWGVAPTKAASLAQVSVASRQAARKRALKALHDWIDVALREQSSSPLLLTRIHAAAEAGTKETGARFLADGTVVLCLDLPGAALREAYAGSGVPWAR